MMKILIADDEPLARERLQALINELGIGEVVAEAANGKDTLELVRVYEPDVLLLDIRMPGIDGMKVIQQLALIESTPAVIFCTAYSDHALEAFEHQALDYLLKPIRKERLEQALKRTYNLKQPQSAPISPSPRARTQISYYQRGELCLVPVNQIYYFYANDKYVMMCCKEEEVLISETLKDLEKEFAGQFLRIHRSTLVAITQITGLKKNAIGITKRYYILLKEVEKPLEVSRRHLKTVKQLLKDMRL
ncbi:MAG: DNA-binding response regulator [Gammaproteobacteria bacterium]|nr:MAG: DNA-binding response regulator [Gammaproteobacteria bacterium]RKZ74388.1 MAG: DNA-binding response regulator [Gammaproteobacteria bacterium]